MASKSEVTFGKKIANAQKVITHVSTFQNFLPPDENTSVTTMETSIEQLRTTNNLVIAHKAGYSQAVAERQLHFVKDDFSLSKLLSPLMAALRSKFGRNAKVVADLAGYTRKIRGVKLKKPDAPKEGQTEEQAQQTISVSHSSYDSKLQHFTDMVATIETLGTNFNPARNDLKLLQLKSKIAFLHSLNNNVSLRYGAFKASINNRLNDYKQLSYRIQQVKDAVSSQYGIKSLEYKLIKGLKV